MGDADADGRLDVYGNDAENRLTCHELGPGTYRRNTTIPRHFDNAYRTHQFDNYEPNDGADNNGDGVPDEWARIPSALTRPGDFYSWFSSPDDVDYYSVGTGALGDICVTPPPGVVLKLSVYSEYDRWNNINRQQVIPDGLPDGLLWESPQTSAPYCFKGNDTLREAGTSRRDFRYIIGITPVSGDITPYWPYWIATRPTP